MRGHDIWLGKKSADTVVINVFKKLTRIILKKTSHKEFFSSFKTINSQLTTKLVLDILSP